VSKDTDIRAKVQYFESEATRFDTMTGEDRARIDRSLLWMCGEEASHTRSKKHWPRRFQ
jgi:hypothetical protein